VEGATQFERWAERYQACSTTCCFRHGSFCSCRYRRRTRCWPQGPHGEDPFESGTRGHGNVRDRAGGG
jgi:hypothetical protein